MPSPKEFDTIVVKRKAGRPATVPNSLRMLLRNTSNWIKWCETVRELAFGVKDDNGKWITRPSLQALELMSNTAYPMVIDTDDDNNIIAQLRSGIAQLSAPPEKLVDDGC